MLGSPSGLSGTCGSREAAPVPVQVWGSTAGSCQSLSLQVLPVAPALPKACAQPLPGLSVSVTIEGLLQTGSWDCSQERLQCHSTDRSDFLRVCLFLFIPLCLPSLWPQPPWARNMANIKSGWRIC